MSYSSQSERMNDSNERNAAVATALYAALGSLDVQLEAELERYRELRERQNTGDRGALDRPVVIPEATIADAVIPIMAAAELPSADSDSDEATSEATSGMSASPFDLNSEDDLEFGGDATDLSGFDESLGETRAIHSGDRGSPETNTTPPDSYLASSEALLASNRNRRRNKRKVSPLGVGGVLLLLLASATVGYVLVNPESLDRFGVRAWFDRKNDPIADNPDSAPVVEAEDNLPTSPNLAAEEFVDIQIDTLSELAPPTTPTPSPTPTSTPTPAADPNSIDNLASALAPQTNPAGSATPNATPNATPTPAPTNAMPPLPEVTPDPNYTGFYLVVVNEGNATALARIQASNPEAYFEQIAGARRIQVGAYDSLAIAQEVVDRIKAQGLPAQVYRP